MSSTTPSPQPAQNQAPDQAPDQAQDQAASEAVAPAAPADMVESAPSEASPMAPISHPQPPQQEDPVAPEPEQAAQSAQPVPPADPSPPSAPEPQDALAVPAVAVPPVFSPEEVEMTAAPVASAPAAVEQEMKSMEEGQARSGESQIGETRMVPENERVTFAWENIRFVVPDRKTKKPKAILDNVSGLVAPGELCCIMGPSGSGKTTLLDALSGRMKRPVEGSVLLNGRPRDDRTFKYLAAYVPQEDHLTGTLTVQESLEFAAELTLPELNHQERLQRIDELLEDFGLDVCREVSIGTVFKKGISGGQKRRTSTAVEVLSSSNRVVFLDEPTSGLDSSSAHQVVSVLRRVAQTGRTILCTIHQPSSQVFAMFDKILLLVEGRVVYFGRTNTLIQHFATIGKELPPATNPADFVMAQVNTDFDPTLDIDHLVKSYIGSPCHIRVTEQLEDQKCLGQPPELRDAGPAGSEDRPCSPDLPVFQDVAKLARMSRAGIVRQTWALTKRTAKDYLRSPGIFWVRTVMYTMLSILMGTAGYDSGVDGDGAVNNRAGMLFFAAAFFIFLSCSLIPFLGETFAVYARETSNGMYSAGPFVFAHTICAIPGLLIISAISIAIIYPLIGYNSDGARWLILLLALFLTLSVAEGLVHMISAVFHNHVIGLAAVAAIFAFFMITQGYFILQEDLGFWIFGYYIGMHRWSFQLMMRNDFEDLELTCESQPMCRFGSGNDVLKFYGMDDVSIGVCFAVLVGMLLFYRVATYFLLRFLWKGKR